jgi:hypothetical protein
MMRRRTRYARVLRLSTLAAVIAAAFAPGTTAAHGGAARLIVEPDRVDPGGVVTIRGDDLGAEAAFAVFLIGPPGRVDLAPVVTDGAGHFELVVRVPAEAPTGAYVIEAVDPTGWGLSMPLTLEGTPIYGEDGAPPGQDEGLPAVVPSGASSAGAPGSEVRPASSAAAAAPLAKLRPVVLFVSSTDPGVDLVPIVALGGAVAALGILFLRTRRPRASPVESADLS